jgi:hypothetical protein
MLGYLSLHWTVDVMTLMCQWMNKSVGRVGCCFLCASPEYFIFH